MFYLHDPSRRLRVLVAMYRHLSGRLVRGDPEETRTPEYNHSLPLYEAVTRKNIKYVIPQDMEQISSNIKTLNKYTINKHGRYVTAKDAVFVICKSGPC